MSKITASALELIGGTPLLKADRYADKAGVKDATILTKLEYLNPAGSVKDRIALAIDLFRIISLIIHCSRFRNCFHTIQIQISILI